MKIQRRNNRNKYSLNLFTKEVFPTGYRHDDDLDVNITLEDLLEDCAGDEELTEFLKDLIQSGDNETVKLSEIGMVFLKFNFIAFQYSE